MSDISFNPFIRPDTSYSPEWGSEVVANLHSPELPEYFRTHQPHGLVFQSVWLVANVIDEQGRKYNLLRRYRAAESILTISSMEVPGLEATPEQIFEPGEMFLGQCAFDMDVHRGCIEIKPFPAGQGTYNIRIRPQRVHWMDVKGQLDLVFTALGPAMEFYIPGRWEDDAYRSEPFQVTGTVKGQAVQGFGVLDTAWGPPGCDFIQSKVYSLLEEYWVIWMNRYANDTYDCGIFLSGKDRFAAGYYNQNGKAGIARTTRISVTHTPDGFLQGAQFVLDEHEFEFTAESRIQQIPSFVSWASGRVLNRGDSRKPTQSFAWFEFFPKK